MKRVPPPPLFTLRGHNSGVTALTSCKVDEITYIISGDQDGIIIIWDLSILRKHVCLENIFSSRIQSLKVIKLGQIQTLFAQSRNQGVTILNLEKIISGKEQDVESPQKLASFPTYEGIFSRGDAINTSDGRAIVAHPSCLDNFLVTIRLLNSLYHTELSGTAQRYDQNSSKKPTVFDMCLKRTQGEDYLLFVAYEDGCICSFSFRTDSTTSLPELNSTGLKIDLVQEFDFGVRDFISAFDITFSSDKLTIVCGSPQDELIFCSQSSQQTSGPDLHKVKLKRQGVASASIRPDDKLVAVSGWDNSVKLYSMKSRKLLASLTNHLKQVQNIIFVERPCNIDGQNYSPGNSIQSKLDLNENKYLLCCASLEGTISISAIY